MLTERDHNYMKSLLFVSQVFAMKEASVSYINEQQSKFTSTFSNKSELKILLKNSEGGLTAVKANG